MNATPDPVTRTFEDGSSATFTHAGVITDDMGPRTAYDYTITAADGSVVAADRISGPVAQDYSPADALAAWSGFMTAYADTYRWAMKDGRTTDADGDPIGPEHEWAYQNEEELQTLDMEMNERDWER